MGHCNWSNLLIVAIGVREKLFSLEKDDMPRSMKRKRNRGELTPCREGKEGGGEGCFSLHLLRYLCILNGLDYIYRIQFN